MFKDFCRKWVIPPEWYRLLGKIRHGFSSHRSKSSPDILNFKDAHKGQRCFILATGPSINQMDLTVLKGEISIAVSFFGYHKDISIIRPRYYVAAPLHSPLTESHALRYLNLFHQFKDQWTMDLFFGINEYLYAFDKVISKHSEIQLPPFHYIDYQNSDGITELNRDNASIWDPLARPYSIFTSVSEALLLAAYMGFQEVYLLGCDYNYMKDLEGKKNQHFYSDNMALEGRENLLKVQNPLETFFVNSAGLWKHYRLIKEHFAGENRDIFNASPDSSFDMFKKIRFEDIFD